MSYRIREEVLTGVPADKAAAIRKVVEEFNSILSESQNDRYRYEERLKQFMADKQKVLMLSTYRLLSLNEKMQNKYEGRTFRITIPLHRIPTTSEWISCEGFIGSYQFDCLLSCGYWHKLRPTLEERVSGRLDLLDHLFELLPHQGKRIGFFTFQNGINNTKADFKDMGVAILRNLPEKPLCIGLYNPAKGIISDCIGVLDKLKGVISDSVCATNIFFTTIAEKLDQFPNKELVWAHLAHSEGGIISEMALKQLRLLKHREHFKGRVLISSYGAVLPVPRNSARAKNTYSKADRATWPRVKHYLESLGEDKLSEREKRFVISLVEPVNRYKDPVPPHPSELEKQFLKLSFSQRMHLLDSYTSDKVYGVADIYWALDDTLKGGDHGFQTETYQRALRSDLDEFRKIGAIYDGK